MTLVGSQTSESIPATGTRDIQGQEANPESLEGYDSKKGTQNTLLLKENLMNISFPVVC